MKEEIENYANELDAEINDLYQQLEYSKDCEDYVSCNEYRIKAIALQSVFNKLISIIYDNNSL